MGGEPHDGQQSAFSGVHPSEEVPPKDGVDVEPPLHNGRYRLVDVLGIRGMATVYRGYDTQLQVFKAIKVLKPEFSRSSSMQTRFLAEARTMARLREMSMLTIAGAALEVRYIAPPL